MPVEQVVTFIETPIYSNEKSKTVSLMRECVNFNFFNFSISFLVGTNTNNSYDTIILLLLLYSFLDRYFAVVYDTCIWTNSLVPVHWLCTYSLIRCWYILTVLVWYGTVRTVLPVVLYTHI